MSRRQLYLDSVTIGVLVVAAGVATSRFLSSASEPTQTPVEMATQRVLDASLTALELQTIDSSVAVANIDLRSDSLTLTFLFSTTCPACAMTKATWDSLADSQPPGTRVLAISSESTDLGGYFRSSSVRVLRSLDSRALQAQFPAGFVPVTIVSRQGTVLLAHIGIFDDRDLDEMRAALER